jgi:hypothetical protein
MPLLNLDTARARSEFLLFAEKAAVSREWWSSASNSNIWAARSDITELVGMCRSASATGGGQTSGSRNAYAGPQSLILLTQS